MLTDSQKSFLDRKLFASFAIVSPTTSLPLVTTVWAHFENDKFYVISNKATAKWRYIEAGQRKVGLNIMDPSGWPYLSVNGLATIQFEEDRSDFWELIERIIRKYNSGQAIQNWLQKMQTAGPEAIRFLIEIEPSNIFSSV